ncbi:Gfo/Idh/MocA family oxidoreductase [Neobacillus cucumis]|nr:Gfo/Idh/MocA family oxidoreductase [Neobacillus cucumis]
MDSKFGVDLSATGVLKPKNGTTAMFDCSMDMESRKKYEIVGTKGGIIVPRPFRPDAIGGEGFVIIQKDSIETIERFYRDIYNLEVGHFSNAILEDGPILYNEENSLQNMRVIDACYASLKQKLQYTCDSSSRSTIKTLILLKESRFLC